MANRLFFYAGQRFGYENWGISTNRCLIKMFDSLLCDDRSGGSSCLHLNLSADQRSATNLSFEEVGQERCQTFSKNAAVERYHPSTC